MKMSPSEKETKRKEASAEHQQQLRAACVTWFSAISVAASNEHVAVAAL